MAVEHGFQDRIKELRRVPASELRANPKNWRRHPQVQHDALAGILQEIGFADAVIARDTPDGLELIDGHLRQEIMGNQPIPVLVVDVTEAEADKLLATIDPLAAMAEMDAKNLSTLLHSLSEGDERLTGLLTRLNEDAAAGIAMETHAAVINGAWVPKDSSLMTGEHADDYVGYDLGSVWWAFEAKHTRLWNYRLPLPSDPGRGNTAWLMHNYSRSPLEEMEHIVRTYMRPGDYFLEVCAGWWTFSATAAMWGYNGAGIDIWDVSLGFGRKQMATLPPESGNVEIKHGDATEMPFADDSFDFLYCNPPFYQLELYSDSQADLARHATLDDWLAACGDMMAEMARVTRPGGLIATIMADYREAGTLIPLAAKWIQEGLNRGLLLHDIAIQRMLSQQVRMWRLAYNKRRTGKSHEYVVVFRVPGDSLDSTVESTPGTPDHDEVSG